MLIDTHAHLFELGEGEVVYGYSSEEVVGVLDRAKAAGVEKIICPGTDLISSKKAVELARRYPEKVYAAVGIHPEETVNKKLPVTLNSAMFNSQMKKLRELIRDNREYIVAVGEVGTDLSNEELKSTAAKQQNLLREQIEIALEYELPVMFHTRNSWDLTMEVIDSIDATIKGQIHCFSYGEEEINVAVEKGLYISFCGNVSWSKRLQKLVPKVPRERLILETDSPFMTPVNESGEKVGKRNEPANAKINAQIQAKLRGDSLEELASYTTENVKRLYKI